MVSDGWYSMDREVDVCVDALTERSVACQCQSVAKDKYVTVLCAPSTMSSRGWRDMVVIIVVTVG